MSLKENAHIFFLLISGKRSYNIQSMQIAKISSAKLFDLSNRENLYP